MSNFEIAFSALIVFLVGFSLVLPDKINLGSIVIDIFQKSTQSGSEVYNTLEQIKSNLKIAGVILIVGDIIYIYFLFSRGN